MQRSLRALAHVATSAAVLVVFVSGIAMAHSGSEPTAVDVQQFSSITIPISPRGNAPDSHASYPKALYPGFKSETLAFKLPALDPHGIRPSLKLHFTAPDRGSHRIRIQLNGSWVEDIVWDSDRAHEATVFVAPADLRVGTNTLVLSTGRVEPEDARISFLNAGAVHFSVAAFENDSTAFDHP